MHLFANLRVLSGKKNTINIICFWRRRAFPIEMEPAKKPKSLADILIQGLSAIAIGTLATHLMSRWDISRPGLDNVPSARLVGRIFVQVCKDSFQRNDWWIIHFIQRSHVPCDRNFPDIFRLPSHSGFSTKN